MTRLVTKEEAKNPGTVQRILDSITTEALRSLEQTAALKEGQFGSITGTPSTAEIGDNYLFSLTLSGVIYTTASNQSDDRRSQTVQAGGEAGPQSSASEKEAEQRERIRRTIDEVIDAGELAGADIQIAKGVDKFIVSSQQIPSIETEAAPEARKEGEPVVPSVEPERPGPSLRKLFD